MQESLLDPARYFSAPGLAWDAALKITKVQLELLSDSDMLLMIESGIRGGIATISHHHAKANNEDMGAEFDPAKDSKFSCCESPWSTLTRTTGAKRRCR